MPDWEQRVKSDPQLRFSSYALQPGQALVFSGSSQWHYREPIDGAAHQAFCDLLFFHFVPRGTAELVRPENWAGLFDIPELAVGSLLAGLGFYMMHNTLQVNATQMVPRARGASVSMFAACFFLGQATGVTLTGWLAASIGTGRAIGIGGAVLLGIGLAFGQALSRRKAQRPSN